MKLQCSCGAKYAFDITPEMVQNPVRFVCPQCGQDSSAFVNELVRKEFGQVAPAAPVAATPPPAPVAAAGVPPPPPVPTGSRLRISHAEAPAPAPAAVAAAITALPCNKHHDVESVDRCLLCMKPICPQCVEKFGQFCSMVCRNQAARARSSSKLAEEEQMWQKTGIYFISGAVAIVLGIVAWVWFAWFGSVPHKFYSVRFEQKSHSGASQVVNKDQIIYLHGGTLARADLKKKNTVWSLELVTPTLVADAMKKEDDRLAKENAEEGTHFGVNMTPARREKMVRLNLEEALSLHVSGQNIWVRKADALTRYDWDTGKVASEIKLPDTYGEVVQVGDELQSMDGANVTHISLASGDTRIEEFRDPHALELASAQRTGAVGTPAAGGLPLGANNGRPLDPNKVAQQAQNLKLPARIALPALLANAQHEQQLEAALKDGETKHKGSVIGKGFRGDVENFRLVPGTNGFVQFSEKLIEEHMITRVAMKAAPKKSALDGEVNASKTTEIANEIMNEMQRNNGGDSVTEDESRYSATVHLPGTSNLSDWTGEVIGPPNLFPQKTVNVVAGSKTVVVLDQTNKKLWQTSLTYPLAYGSGGHYGEGPCVEHGDTLYVFDQAVLSAYDLMTGNARWRLPSVGVVGIFFDDQGMIYVNTTTGNPDDLKYSRQIDISKSTSAVLLKIDPKTGKTLWRVEPGGFVSYLSGKFIYTVEGYDPGDQEDELSDTMSMLTKPAYMHITRINPKNGRTMWDYQEDRCPVNSEFHQNSIELVFKKEVEVLHYLSF